MGVERGPQDHTHDRAAEPRDPSQRAHVALHFAVLRRAGAERQLSYINAGHPPPLLLDTRGIRQLGVGGILLDPIPTRSTSSASCTSIAARA